MTIAPTITLDNKAGWNGNTTLVLDNVRAAFGVWSQILAGDASVHVRVEIANLGSSGSSRILASASIDDYAYTGRYGGYLTYESPIATELKSGNLQTSYGHAVTIRIDSSSLSNGTYFIDPRPLTSTAPTGITGSQYDLLSVLVHEVAHTLGMTGWRSAGGTLSGSSQSVFDSLVTKVNNQLFFEGENVKVAVGSYPLLDTNSVYHFQSTDLLDPYAEPGTRVQPSRLDAALLADLGMATIYNDLLDTNWGRTLKTGSGFDVVSLDTYKSGLMIRGTGTVDVVTAGFQELKLIDAERLVLVDAQVTLPDNGFVVRFDEDGVGGYAYRLYKAAFDRTPDAKGLGSWIKYLDEGGGRDFVAQSFVNSFEFNTKYGPLDNTGFVQRLYNNVLGRNGEAQGVFGWVDGLAHGLSRAQVLQGFSESSENIGKTAALTGNGILYQEWWLA
jgi:hypothetical protein